MAKGGILHRGKVLEALPQTMFKVELHDGRMILASICGRMFLNNIRVLPGDTVEVAVPSIGDRGRIEKRYK